MATDTVPNCPVDKLQGRIYSREIIEALFASISRGAARFYLRSRAARDGGDSLPESLTPVGMIYCNTCFLFGLSK
jgi:hypothetical protein